MRSMRSARRGASAGPSPSAAVCRRWSLTSHSHGCCVPRNFATWSAVPSEHMTRCARQGGRLSGSSAHRSSTQPVCDGARNAVAIRAIRSWRHSASTVTTSRYSSSPAAAMSARTRGATSSKASPRPHKNAGSSWPPAEDADPCLLRRARSGHGRARRRRGRERQTVLGDPRVREVLRLDGPFRDGGREDGRAGGVRGAIQVGAGGFDQLGSASPVVEQLFGPLLRLRQGLAQPLGGAGIDGSGRRGRAAATPGVEALSLMLGNHERVLGHGRDA